MSNFLYQAAQDAAKLARRVYNAYYKKTPAPDGEEYEPKIRVKVELGYDRKWKVGNTERVEFITSKQLNKVLEAYFAKHMEEITAQAVEEMESAAIEMARNSVESVRAELERLESEYGPGPEVA